MAPFPIPHKSEDGVDEVMELQNTAHYSPNIPSGIQPISILDSINSVLHVSTKSTNNGSQPGSSSGFLSPSSSGQGEQEEESDLVVLLSLFVPLAATVTAIFIIALFVRRMRRAGSVNEIQHRASSNSNNNNLNKNEFQMQMMSRKKISAHSTSSTSSSSSSSTSTSPSHNKNRSLASTKSSKAYGSSMDSFPSSGRSIYRNSSYLHLQLQHQSSLPASLGSVGSSGAVNTSPVAPPPWPLAAESGLYYTRSHYGLNKLHQQLYQQASLQAFASVQNLNGLVTRQSSYCSDSQSPYCTQSDPEIDVSSSGDDSSSSSKKSTHKKFKRVLNAINFPQKIRQYQADRKRFNIYTIPVETREQLKHIYVY